MTSASWSPPAADDDDEDDDVACLPATCDDDRQRAATLFNPGDARRLGAAALESWRVTRDSPRARGNSRSQAHSDSD
jgi:hypothetical protein